MKSAVIIFHKNVTTYYPKAWVDKCVASIRNQSYKDFDVFELDYGGEGNLVYEYPGWYLSSRMDNHAEAHNYLLDVVFKLGYDCAFNVNIDDWYALNRFEKQIPWIEKGYDVVSSNFYRTDGDENTTRAYHFSDKDIITEANKGHNIIAHPVLCYSRNFWTTCDKLDPKDIPQDDFVLWKKSYKKGCYKFIILPQFLLFQRIHANNVSKKNGSTNVRVDISRNRKIR